MISSGECYTIASLAGSGYRLRAGARFGESRRSPGAGGKPDTTGRDHVAPRLQPSADRRIQSQGFGATNLIALSAAASGGSSVCPAGNPPLLRRNAMTSATSAGGEAARLVRRHADARPVEEIAHRTVVPVHVEVFPGQRRRLAVARQVGLMAARRTTSRRSLRRASPARRCRRRPACVLPCADSDDQQPGRSTAT